MDHSNRMRPPSNLVTYSHGLGGSCIKVGQTFDVTYIDSTFLTFCLRLCGISKVWCYFICIRGCR